MFYCIMKFVTYFKVMSGHPELLDGCLLVLEIKINKMVWLQTACKSLTNCKVESMFAAIMFKQCCL